MIIEDEGWRIRSSFLQELAQGKQEVTEDVYSALLDADLRKVGIGCLSEEIAKGKDFAIKEPYVLQLVSVRDIAQPVQRDDEDGRSKKRLMLIALTDGRSAIRCLDDKGLTTVPSNTPPGTKIRLRGGTVRRGVIMLDADSLEILGGRVASLAEEWEFEQKFGKARAGGDEEEQAPAFAQYDPRKPRSGIHLEGFSTSAVLSHSAEQSSNDQGTSTRTTFPSSSSSIFRNKEIVKRSLLAETPSTSASTSETRRGRGRGRQRESAQVATRTLTLEEYEAHQQQRTAVSNDAVLARQLDQEINHPQQSDERELMAAMFSYAPAQETSTGGRHRGHGRGRRSRGRRGRGRR